MESRMDTGKELNKNKNYWLRLLEKIEERQDIKRLSSFKEAGTHTVHSEPRGGHCDSLVEAETYERVHKITQGNRDTLATLLLSIWHVVLHVYSFSLQTVVGIVQPDQNVIPSIVSHDYQTGQSYADFLEYIRKDIENNQMHVFGLTADVRQAYKALLDNAFAYEHDSIRSTGIDVPIALCTSVSSGALKLRLEYTDFMEQDATQFLTTFSLILSQISLCPKLKLSQLTFVSPDEQKAILRKIVIKEIPFHQTMSKIFEEQVDRVPNNVAVITETTRLTYKELDTRANQVAHWILKTVEVKPETIVALCLNQSEQIEICILAVWKAGAAYVAIDPSYPQERKAFILNDTKSTLILTDSDNWDNISTVGGNRIILNVQTLDLDSVSCSRPIGTTSNSESLSHLVYTSGTTGQPKGVLTLHKALINHCLDYKERYTLGEKEVILLFFNYVFNAFSEPLTLALSNGFPLLVVQKSLLLQTQKLYGYMQKNKLTHIDATPSLLGMLDLRKIRTLKRVATGGEILTPEVYAKVKKEVPNVLFYNVFGNTEGSLCTMTSLLRKYESTFQRHVTNKQCLVLGSNLSLAPLNAVGELCFTGIGVARGYQNNDQLTKERFLPNLFQPELAQSSRMFRTGDIGRRLRNGSIEYLGRRDLQIKIRGFRVELGEIESAIRSFPGILQSVVTANVGVRSEEVQIMGYYVAEDEADPDDVGAHIRRFLPDYMLPARLIQLAEFPLTQNGKINRKALPDINSNVAVARQEKPALQSVDSLAKKVRNIWEDILGLPLDTIDCEEDFFDLGGNSLMAMALGERIGTELGCALDAAFLYNNSTVNEFVEQLKDPDMIRG